MINYVVKGETHLVRDGDIIKLDIDKGLLARKI
jgi:phosphohistidine swiveling domain-containing protein